jgi:hypothetical protein
MSDKSSRDGASAPTEGRRKRPSRPSRSSLGIGTSTEANRRATAVLEVLGGLRTPSEAAQVLNISVTHYYVLERKALHGLLHGCEPRPKGPRAPSTEKQLVTLKRQLERCQRECMRQAALVRATQRALGFPATNPGRSSGKKARASTGGKPRRRPTARALRAVETLRKNSSGPNSPGKVEHSSPHGVADDQSRRTDEEQQGGTQG